MNNNQHVLIVGFGNQFRRDDGVGPYVVNLVRVTLGLLPLEPLDDGFDTLGEAVDTIVLHQLTPELAETIKDYELLIFVDAHVGNLPDPIREVRLDAAYTQPFVSHQFHPSTVLALAQQLYGHAPRTVLFSIRGHDFDFGEGLSPETQVLARAVATRIMATIQEVSGNTDCKPASDVDGVLIA
jgi:hydrogenase maturation protease